MLAFSLINDDDYVGRLWKKYRQVLHAYYSYLHADTVRKQA